MQSLLDALEPEFGPGRVFRPYRDVRFSTDKSPYKTQAAASVTSPDGHSLYVQLNAAGLLAGGGYYHLGRGQLSRYRAAVTDDLAGAELARIARALIHDGFTMIGERLTRAPRGADPAHPRIDLLRHKGLASLREFGVQDWLDTPRCLDVVAATWRRIEPLNAWLGTHVGPPEAGEADRRYAR
jgi:uncharacterized protein (TIGR02453 family)